MIGIFGGTFDPIHLGHRHAVDQLCQALPLTRVHWVLSARPPHKDQVSAHITHRFAMLELALADQTMYQADDTEIVRPEKSYTIDTVEVFKQRYPDALLCVVIGGDSLQNLHTWRRYDNLMQSVHWIVMHRPGYPLEVPRELAPRLVESPAELQKHKCGKLWVFSGSNFDISSTQIRGMLSEVSLRDSDLRVDSNQLQEEESLQNEQRRVRECLSPNVIDYIRTHKLYIKPNIEPDTTLYTKSKSAELDKIMNADQVKDQVINALEDVKAQDIKVLDIADISDFADYMIVASGTSDTHVKALARSASDKLRVQGVKPLNEDGSDVGEWVLVDFGDVVLHVMRPEVRAYYDLEKLWDEDVRKLVEQHREDRDE